MKHYGLLGHPVKQSISPKIHTTFVEGITYTLLDVPKKELKNTLNNAYYSGFNVTIPYKEEVIAYLDEVSDAVKSMHACNTVVRKDNLLIGHNTDYKGFIKMLEENNIDLTNKKVAILGSGGASKAVGYALDQMHVAYDVISRHAKPFCITYDTLYAKSDEYHAIINTTPVGMVPNSDLVPMDITKFKNVDTVIDVIANPYRTKLLFEAQKQGCKVCGGLDMLINQAYFADYIFFEDALDRKKIPSFKQELLYDFINVYLIGMPTCGKTTIGKEVSKRMNKQWFDLDDVIQTTYNIDIPTYLKNHGEHAFRMLEQACAKDMQQQHGVIVSCGGGVVENEETMRYLFESGIVIFIDRSLDTLLICNDRPLSNTKDKMLTLYNRRLPLYNRYSDIRVENNTDLETVIHRVIEIMKGQPV